LGLFTSETESFCLSILEAMAFACPSVSTNVGGIPEVIDDGVNGLLAPSGDADALARAAEALLADPMKRRALGTAGQAKARSVFSAAAIVPQYLALYRRVCGVRP
jgi:glycosyltransferase involved in cell wall biosynthesis